MYTHLAIVHHIRVRTYSFFFLVCSFIISLQLRFSPGDVVIDHDLYVLRGRNGSASGVISRTACLQCVCVCVCEHEYVHLQINLYGGVHIINLYCVLRV